MNNEEFNVEDIGSSDEQSEAEDPVYSEDEAFICDESDSDPDSEPEEDSGEEVEIVPAKKVADPAAASLPTGSIIARVLEADGEEIQFDGGPAPKRPCKNDRTSDNETSDTEPISDADDSEDEDEDETDWTDASPPASDSDSEPEATVEEIMAAPRKLRSRRAAAVAANERNHAATTQYLALLAEERAELNGEELDPSIAKFLGESGCSGTSQFLLADDELDPKLFIAQPGDTELCWKGPNLAQYPRFFLRSARNTCGQSISELEQKAGGRYESAFANCRSYNMAPQYFLGALAFEYAARLGKMPVLNLRNGLLPGPDECETPRVLETDKAQGWIMSVTLSHRLLSTAIHRWGVSLKQGLCDGDPPKGMPQWACSLLQWMQEEGGMANVTLCDVSEKVLGNIRRMVPVDAPFKFLACPLTASKMPENSNAWRSLSIRLPTDKARSSAIAAECRAFCDAQHGLGARAEVFPALIGNMPASSETGEITVITTERLFVEAANLQDALPLLADDENRLSGAVALAALRGAAAWSLFQTGIRSIELPKKVKCPDRMLQILHARDWAAMQTILVNTVVKRAKVPSNIGDFVLSVWSADVAFQRLLGSKHKPLWDFISELSYRAPPDPVDTSSDDEGGEKDDNNDEAVFQSTAEDFIAV